MPSQQYLFMLQAVMWKHTVWPKLPPNKWEKDQPSKHDDAIITVLWDQLVGSRCAPALQLILCSTVPCCWVLHVDMCTASFFMYALPPFGGVRQHRVCHDVLSGTTSIASPECLSPDRTAAVSIGLRKWQLCPVHSYAHSSNLTH